MSNHSKTSPAFRDRWVERADRLGTSKGRADAEPQAAEILAIQVEQAYRQLPIALVVNTINGLLLTAILWGVLDSRRLLIWLGILYGVTASRFYLALAYRQPHHRAARSQAQWGHSFVLGALASGLVWGGAGVSLFPTESVPYQVFLAFALGGMVAGALPLLSALPPAYYCFAIPTALPIMLEFLLVGDRLHLTMALMILIFTLAMLEGSAQFHRVLRESIELRLRLTTSLEERRALAHLARIDELTGIANRRLFDEALASEWKRAQRTGKVLALIIADIDYFKLYNDHLGHVAGDACLARVAETMAVAVRRPGDLAARIGGEEFAFLLPDTSLMHAALVAERIRDDVLALRIAHPASLIARSVTISLGVAAVTPAAEHAESELVQAADLALYQAKALGRNQVAIAA